jgi:hypothetical protein
MWDHETCEEEAQLWNLLLRNTRKRWASAERRFDACMSNYKMYWLSL